MLAAALGTLAGNPWTFPLMFAASYRVGCWLLGQQASSITALGFAGLVDNLWAFFWPMMVGSLPLMVVAWVVSYLLLVRPIAAFQERRRRRRTAKAHGRLVPAQAPPRA
jgi:uncharacterized protein (DUF2062 family)